LRASTAPVVGDEIVAKYTDSIFHAKLCTSDTKFFLFHNQTCGDIEISGIDLTDSTSFGIVSPRSFPVLLPADSTLRVDLLFNAEDTLSHNALLHYETSDG